MHIKNHVAHNHVMQKSEATSLLTKQCSLTHNTGTRILKLTICNVLVTKDCLEQFMNINTILNLPFIHRTNHIISA